MQTQPIFWLKSPCKVNPHLYILHRQSDGFHALSLSFVALNVWDALVFYPEAEGVSQVEVRGGRIEGPPESNLVYRAIMAFRQATGIKDGLRVVLHKQLPTGAGLGGGSANAAATLAGLNGWQGNVLPPQTLHKLATGLGADVPYFLDPRPMLGGGKGEVLTPWVEFPTLHVVVAKPPLSIPTALAYARCMPFPREVPESPKTILEVLALLDNDFEKALFGDFPELKAVKQALMDAGALGALLSGSGAACFGVFDTAEAAAAGAQRLLKQNPDWWVRAAKSLNGHSYWPPESGPVPE